MLSTKHLKGMKTGNKWELSTNQTAGFYQRSIGSMNPCSLPPPLHRRRGSGRGGARTKTRLCVISVSAVAFLAGGVRDQDNLPQPQTAEEATNKSSRAPIGTDQHTNAPGKLLREATAGQV